ncbi:MAG: hypothetical protein WB566_02450 [Terriglobales bacterium]
MKPKVLPHSNPGDAKSNNYRKRERGGRQLVGNNAFALQNAVRERRPGNDS